MEAQVEEVKAEDQAAELAEELEAALKREGEREEKSELVQRGLRQRFLDIDATLEAAIALAAREEDRFVDCEGGCHGSDAFVPFAALGRLLGRVQDELQEYDQIVEDTWGGKEEEK